MRRILLSLGLVGTLAIALGWWWVSRPNQTTPEQSIVTVASKLDIPFGSVSADDRKLLVLPDTYTESDLDVFVTNYRIVFDDAWILTLQRAGLDVGWPGDLRYLAHGQGGSAPTPTTSCPDANERSGKVNLDTGTIFYCATDSMDSMQVPGMVSYPQGTLWVPLKALQQPINVVGPTAIPRGQQAAQALFVHLTAEWADGLSRQIRAFAAAQWKINLPRLEQANLALEFAYCVAGAMGLAVFGPYSAVAAAVYMLYGDETGMPMSVNAAALKDGFAKGTIGACVRSYWPTTNFPS